MSNSGLSQDEINAIIAGNVSNEYAADNSPTLVSDILSDIEKDILGEVGNISMGSASTALSDMLGKKVSITTPVVSVTTLKKMRDSFEMPNIALEIKYVAGISGKNVLYMRVSDAAVVANLMMGGDGNVTSTVLSEIEESAVSEAMNQMMGSSATSMATLFSRKVDISPPVSKIWDSFTSNMIEDIYDNDEVIQVAFKLTIEGLVDSVIMQVMSLEAAKKIISIMMGTETSEETVNTVQPTEIVIESKQDVVEKIKEAALVIDESSSRSNVANSTGNSYIEDSAEDNIHRMEYKSFSDYSNVSRNTTPLFNVPLNVQLVLGTAQRSIKEIMNFNSGTILELNQLPDQPIELHVNGKIIGYGEVIIVNGNLGVRIIDINKNDF